MKVGDAIAVARKERGLTQEQLAAQVYVTRQAVSRWEQGESAPSIDMRKLLAGVLSIPTTMLLELPDEPTCQCCGTPFDVPNMPYGTNADGSENRDYCKWCYENGSFTSDSLDALIERNVPFLVAATGYSEEEAVSFMGAVMPTLKRWRETENHNRSANAAKSIFYACPTCGNIAWSMGDLATSCCGKPLEPLKARKNSAHDGTQASVLPARIDISDGCHVVSIEHPMTKEDHLSFIACVGDDLVRIKRLYPQQDATATFFIQGPCRHYAYGKECGLVQLD